MSQEQQEQSESKQYKHAPVLQDKATQFAKALNDAGFVATVLPDTIRDYHIKINVCRDAVDYGNIVLYYRPSEQVFSPKVHELRDKSIASDIETCWHGLQPAGVKPVPLQADAVNLASVRDKLREGATAFAAYLRERGLDATMLPDSVRDYSIAIRVQQPAGLGQPEQAIQDGQSARILLYYSPNNDAYKLSVRYVKQTVFARLIDDHWHTYQRAIAKDEMLQVAKTPYQAYVDGSFMDNRIGYGAVILHNGEEIARLSGRIKQYLESRQIAGEFAATMRVVDWCHNNGIEAIDIFYDYKGIYVSLRSPDAVPSQQRALHGQADTQDEPDDAQHARATQHYRAYMQKRRVQIHWHRVSSHSGNYWNDVADELAKSGARMD